MEATVTELNPADSEEPQAQPEAPAQEPDLEGEGDGEQGDKLFDLQLEGDKELNSKVGGRKPDKATVKLRGGSIIVPQGQYEKGDTVNVLVSLRCAELHFVDKIDNSTGEIVETERRQVMKITNVEKVD